VGYFRGFVLNLFSVSEVQLQFKGELDDGLIISAGTLFLFCRCEGLKLNMTLMSTGLEFLGGNGWRRLSGQY